MSKRHFLPAAAVLLFLTLPAYIKSNYLLSILIIIGIYAIVTQGLGILMGYAGQVSFGQAAFFGLGSYAVAFDHPFSLAGHPGAPGRRPAAGADCGGDRASDPEAQGTIPGPGHTGLWHPGANTVQRRRGINRRPVRAGRCPVFFNLRLLWPRTGRDPAIIISVSNKSKISF